MMVCGRPVAVPLTRLPGSNTTARPSTVPWISIVAAAATVSRAEMWMTAPSRRTAAATTRRSVGRAALVGGTGAAGGIDTAGKGAGAEVAGAAGEETGAEVETV